MSEDFQSRGFEAPYDTRTLNWRGHIHIGGRQVQALNGSWDFLTDPYDAALRQKRFRDTGIEPASRTTPWEFDFDAYDRMPVPGTWSSVPELTHYEGTAWYHRRLSVRPQGDRIFLRVGAANYDAKIFLNGVFLGNHSGGSTPFFVELTQHLTGDDALLIAVNNARRGDRVPTDNTDWTNHGGIHREVALLRLPSRFIRDLFLRLDDDGSHIVAEIAVEGDLPEVRLRLPDLAIDATLPVTDGRASARLAATPRRWSPDDPVLYDVEVSAGSDRITDRVGFRILATDGTRILLNGQPIFLRGISVHEDDATTGRCTSDEDIRRRFRHAKELNCNFLRLAHYPHHERAAQIADEEGLLLWEEVPVYWSIAWDHPATFADADNQLRELILRDRNRASVILWSVGNENADSDPRLSFLSRLHRACCSILWGHGLELCVCVLALGLGSVSLVER